MDVTVQDTCLPASIRFAITRLCFLGMYPMRSPPKYTAMACSSYMLSGSRTRERGSPSFKRAIFLAKSFTNIVPTTLVFSRKAREENGSLGGRLGSIVVGRSGSTLVGRVIATSPILRWCAAPRRTARCSCVSVHLAPNSGP